MLVWNGISRGFEIPIILSHLTKVCEMSGIVNSAKRERVREWVSEMLHNECRLRALLFWETSQLYNANVFISWTQQALYISERYETYTTLLSKFVDIL